jgi:hypothetical protein
MVKEPWGDWVLRVFLEEIEAVPALGRSGRPAWIEGLAVETGGAGAAVSAVLSVRPTSGIAGGKGKTP